MYISLCFFHWSSTDSKLMAFDLFKGHHDVWCFSLLFRLFFVLSWFNTRTEREAEGMGTHITYIHYLFCPTVNDDTQTIFPCMDRQTLGMHTVVGRLELNWCVGRQIFDCLWHFIVLFVSESLSELLAGPQCLLINTHNSWHNNCSFDHTVLYWGVTPQK